VPRGTAQAKLTPTQTVVLVAVDSLGLVIAAYSQKLQAAKVSSLVLLWVAFAGYLVAVAVASEGLAM